MTQITNALFPVIHILSFFGLLLALILLIRKKYKPAGYAFLIALAGLFVNFILIIIAAKRLPLYGMFESLTTILCIVGMCLYLSKPFQASPKAIIGYGVMTLISGFMLFFPLQLNHDFFMYSSPWVQSFFFFRLMAAGIILFTGIRFTAELRSPSTTNNPILPPKPIYLLFLFGTVLFLCSEFSGSVWCLKGWGDSWHWSENFFQSAAIFFLVMLNLHIPIRTFRTQKSRSVLGALSAYTIVFLFLW